LKIRHWRTALLSALLCLTAVPAFAQSSPSQGFTAVPLNSGDTAWMLTSTALVLIMTPGLAFFYGGMVRSKNVLSVLMQSFVACGLVTIQWCIFGYSLGFGPDQHGMIGDLSWAFLKNVSSYKGSVYAPTIPHQVYCMFQLMFAIITPALISGGIVERMKFSSYCLFMLLWATFVYDPLAHWVWGHNGFLGGVHLAEDFAGGSVVHMSSGFSALTLAMMLGKRKRSEGGEELRPHNLPMTALGTALLWFGWFGFNAGSACSSGQLAANAFTATHIATGTAAMTWMCLDWIFYKKPTALGFCSGAVAGLVVITPMCGFVTPMGGMIGGIVVSCVCFFTIKLKHLLKADDALDVFGVHGCGGLTGCMLTGLLSTSSVNSAAWNGVLNGGGIKAIVPQLWDASCTILVSVIGTLIVGGVTGLLTGGLRASDEAEENGLDLADHGEVGYSSESSGSPVFATA
jgi:Amt family ammonium transporter